MDKYTKVYKILDSDQSDSCVCEDASEIMDKARFEEIRELINWLNYRDKHSPHPPAGWRRVVFGLKTLLEKHKLNHNDFICKKA